MKFQLTKDVIFEKIEGGVTITRPSILGGIHTHTIKSAYEPAQIMMWLKRRIYGERNPMVQDAFPDMSKDDREFLMTGITPAKWAEVFADGEDE
jgi:hypothetical protein